MPLGRLLTTEFYGGRQFLSAINLELCVALHLRGLEVSFEWHNEYGESNNFPDMRVENRFDIDCKGSDKYHSSMFIGLDAYDKMTIRRESNDIWYVLNDLSVVSFDEFDEQKVRKATGYAMRPAKPRSLIEWLEEQNVEHIDR